MNPPQTIDTASVQRAQQHVRDIMGEIAGLASAGLAPQQFYAELLAQVIRALAAAGGAVWIVSDDGKRLEPESASQFPLGGMSADLLGQQRHFRLLRQALTSGETAVVPPRGSLIDDEEIQNPTEYLLLLAPLRSQDRPQGVLEVFLRPGKSAAMQQSYAKFITKVCRVAEPYFAAREVQQQQERVALWQQAEALGQTLHRSLDLSETSYALANEACRIIDCDRASVVVGHGRKTRVQAVSGQDKVEHRAALVRLLNELTRRVLATGEPFWFDGTSGELPPQIEESLQAYIDLSHTRALSILPLFRPHNGESDVTNATDPATNEAELIGALVVEKIGQGEFAEKLRQRVDFVGRIGSSALANALTYDRVFLMPLWRALEKTHWFVEARRLPKTILCVATVLTVMAALCLIPADFRIASHGTLQPAQRQDVFVQESGVITQVYVDHGASVKAGDKLLRLESRDLDVAVAEVQGKMGSALEQVAAARRAQGEPRLTTDRRNRISGQFAQAQASYESLHKQLELLQAKRELLVVRSPIDGVAVTWDLRNRLQGRPVEKGQLLLTVANPDGGWELELLVPENHSGFVARAWQENPLPQRSLDVAYLLATSAAKSHNAEVVELQSTAEVRGEDGNTVLVRAKIDPKSLDANELRPGATVMGQIHCGRRAIGFVWFHDVLAFIRTKILFRI